VKTAFYLPATLLCSFLMSACSGSLLSGSQRPDSDLFLFNGRNIPEETHPHVYSIGGCTATFVSDNTLITAGHCVSRGGAVRVARRLNARSLKVIHNPRYSGTGVNDVAIAIFPRGTAQATAPVFFGRLGVGDDVFAVGYGCTNGGGSGGTKREGVAKIASLSNGVIGLRRSSDAPGSGNDVTLCPGDSGGPLFRNGAVVGIASFWDGGAGRSSGHADLTAQSNRDFMRSVVEQHGAVIPGLDGPVVPDGIRGTTGLYAAITGQTGNSLILSTAAAASSSEMVICPGRNSLSCNASSPGAVSSSSRSVLGAQAVYGFMQTFDPFATPELVIAALDAGGKVTATRVIRIKQK
jgi:hypothetical protein